MEVPETSTQNISRSAGTKETTTLQYCEALHEMVLHAQTIVNDETFNIDDPESIKRNVYMFWPTNGDTKEEIQILSEEIKLLITHRDTLNRHLEEMNDLPIDRPSAVMIKQVSDVLNHELEKRNAGKQLVTDLIQEPSKRQSTQKIITEGLYDELRRYNAEKQFLKDLIDMPLDRRNVAKIKQVSEDLAQELRNLESQKLYFEGKMIEGENSRLSQQEQQRQQEKKKKRGQQDKKKERGQQDKKKQGGQQGLQNWHGQQDKQKQRGQHDQQERHGQKNRQKRQGKQYSEKKKAQQNKKKEKILQNQQERPTPLYLFRDDIANPIKQRLDIKDKNKKDKNKQKQQGQQDQEEEQGQEDQHQQQGHEEQQQQQGQQDQQQQQGQQDQQQGQQQQQVQQQGQQEQHQQQRHLRFVPVCYEIICGQQQQQVQQQEQQEQHQQQRHLRLVPVCYEIICDILILLCLLLPLASAQCSTCLERRCYDTGQCMLGCVPGYMSRYCDETCPSNCLNNACEVNTTSGTITCTDGCRPGYCGTKCTRPCPEGCVTCDRQCGSCNKTRCPERRFGDGCRGVCSPTYAKCHQVTGECIKCKQGYYGDYCDQMCLTCFHSGQKIKYKCLSGCDMCKDQDLCPEGFFGGICELECSATCGLSSETGGHPCNRATGECSAGCVPGYHGLTCNNTCNEFCEGGLCNQHDGVCTSGCVSGYTLKSQACEKLEGTEVKDSTVYLILVISCLITSVSVLTLLTFSWGLKLIKRSKKFEKFADSVRCDGDWEPLVTGNLSLVEC